MGDPYMGTRTHDSVSDAASDAVEIIAGEVDVEGIVNKIGDKLTNMFSTSAWDPDNKDIYDRRADIKSEFHSQVMKTNVAETNGHEKVAMDPIVAEEMEQLALVYPDEVSDQYRNILDNVESDPAKYGMETGATSLFTDNEGVSFAALEQ